MKMNMEKIFPVLASVAILGLEVFFMVHEYHLHQHHLLQIEKELGEVAHNTEHVEMLYALGLSSLVILLIDLFLLLVWRFYAKMQREKDALSKLPVLTTGLHKMALGEESVDKLMSKLLPFLLKHFGSEFQGITYHAWNERAQGLDLIGRSGVATENLPLACLRVKAGQCTCGQVPLKCEVLFKPTGKGVAKGVAHYSVPVIHGDRFLGVLNFFTEEGFSDGVATHLHIVARILSEILLRKEQEFARLRDLEQRDAELMIFHTLMTHLLTAGGEVEEVFKIIFRALWDIHWFVGSDNPDGMDRKGLAFRLEGERLVRFFSVGEIGATVESSCAAVGPGFCFCGKVLTSILEMKRSGNLNSPYCLFFSADMEGHMPIPNGHAHGHWMLVVPVEEDVYVLTFYTHQDYEASAEDHQFLRTIGNVLVLACGLRRSFLRITQERDRAEVANRAKNEFLANITHELKTPLSVIMTFSQALELLRAGKMEGDERKAIEGIEKASKKLLELINEILDLSRLQKGGIPLEMNTIDLVQLTREVVKSFERTHTLDLSISGEGMCQGDRGWLTKLLTNLVGNASRYTQGVGTSVEVSFRSYQDPDTNQWMVEGSVKDDGTGIAKGELEIIFGSFAEGSRTKTKAGGTGLGLAICRKVVEAHGGKIWAEHNAPTGAIFRFVLPQDGPSLKTKMGGFTPP